MATANKIELVSDRVQRAKNLLLAQFKESPNINSLVEVFVEEVQKLEVSINELQIVRTLEGAYGSWLDEIGRRNKVARGNFMDDDYRTAIKIAMVKKTASSTIDNILRIVELLTQDDEVRIENNYPYFLQLYGFLFCVDESESGLSAIADLFPTLSRIELIKRDILPFKFGTVGQGFGSGSTLNSLVYRRAGNSEDPRFTTVPQAIIPPPVDTPVFVITLPFITGDNMEGATLTLTQGTFGGDDPIVLTQQWLRDGSNISGETAISYIVTSADLGKNISCSVTATNDFGVVLANTNAINISEVVPPTQTIVDGLGLTDLYSFVEATTSTTVYNSIKFNNDGTITLDENGTTDTSSFLTTTGTDAADGYTLSYTIVSGLPLSGLNANTSYTLTTDITLTQTFSMFKYMVRSGTYLFTIREISNPSNVKTKQITMTTESTGTD